MVSGSRYASSAPPETPLLLMLSRHLRPLLVALALPWLSPFARAEVRGFAIAAPAPAGVERFVAFIENELAPRAINTLVLRVDYGYAYQSHPELRDENPLTAEHVARIVDVCRRHGIRIVPQINLLGHQSWHSELGRLLTVYPQFDETPDVTLPEVYQWPNPDGLYCKSYCPRHPDLHAIVFALVDEIVAAFEADAFHAGMDEVFYLGDEDCPRCGGHNKAQLFADEVTRIRDHLARQDRELWIWGDRLIDGEVTDIGMWEASTNGTAPAIDLIPRDVVICDWHYERAEPTAALFALKGLRVITCSWNRPAVGRAQVAAYRQFQRDANPVLAERYLGLMHTVWTSAERFLDAYAGSAEVDENLQGQVDCFHAMFDAPPPPPAAQAETPSVP